MNRYQGRFRIGTSGFHYEHWKGIFYPEDLPKSRWFSHYVRNFDTVELNNTFYRLPSASTFDAWKKQAPKNFCYALKFNRYGSHLLRLKRPRPTISKFLGVAKRLGEFLGPVLVQLPPRWNVNIPRLESFLAAAPRAIRWAIEFRDPCWLCPEVFALLERHRAALCIHDMIEDHPRTVTATWTYLRYHGEHYGGTYTPQRLAADARWIRKQLASGKDVFVYFNNDAQGYAVRNAADLKHRVTR
jgi:uncharacterized protein YecE (DUF72 family)